MIVRKVWPPLTALALVAVAAVVAWSWRGDLPDPVASHWSSGSAAPDRFMPLGGFVAISVVMVVLLCLPFGAMWADWLTTLRNSEGGGLLYSSLEVFLLALPLAAWWGRTRGG